ncbi:MAG: HlyD family efflux transporter periplasmic adaptor subunit, partial [Phycisphaera sp.]|nr:HlyD family efflux transporter periplasmic adaptor subunit [Phycisphaera sp.]
KLIEAEAALKEARLAEKVFEQYTIKQDRAQRTSAVDQSVAEKGRVRQRHEAEIVKIEADVESVRFKLQTARERLDDLRAQLDSCIVRAPTDGLVVYASSLSGERRGRGDEPPPQVGTELRQNELVMILPDVTRMLANLKVGEALSGKVVAGQQVTVYSDSLPNVPIVGRVDGVSVLAESGGWRDPNRRDYTVRVLLEVDPDLGLKPSMRCRGEIVLGQVQDVVNVPVQSVFRRGRLAYVYVPEDGGFSEREVRIGRSSEMSVEILDGLAVGDSVLLRRPTPGEVVAELPPNSAGGMQWAGGRPGGSSGATKGAGGPPKGVAGSTRGRPSSSSAKGNSPANVSSRPTSAKKSSEPKPENEATS